MAEDIVFIGLCGSGATGPSPQPSASEHVNGFKLQDFSADLATNFEYPSLQQHPDTHNLQQTRRKKREIELAHDAIK